MKTTVDISDALLREAKAVATKKGIPFRQVVEKGLRSAIRELRGKSGFKLQDCSFRGADLTPGTTWDEILDKGYEREPDENRRNDS